MDTLSYLSEHYQSYDEMQRLASRHGQVEFLTTVKYIEKYLEPSMRLLEIGAGPGRYSHYFARQGYQVTAVELVQHNIEIFTSLTEPGEDIAVMQGNATDLSGISSDSFDMTFLLGPMYHLYSEQDKQCALSEALRVTREGGVVFVSYCVADASILCYGFIQGQIHLLVEKGLLDPETFKASSTPAEVFELHRREDIDSLMAGFNTERLHYVATDGYTNHMRETVDAMDDRTFEIYLKYHFSICERPDMTGLTHHSLDIFRKKRGTRDAGN